MSVYSDRYEQLNLKSRMINKNITCGIGLCHIWIEEMLRETTFLVPKTTASISFISL